MTLFYNTQLQSAAWMSLLLLTLSACDQKDLAAPADRASPVVTPDRGQLTRFATLPLGAENTGLFISPKGDLFFNVQHPAPGNAEPYNRAVVGVVTGLNIQQLPGTFAPVNVPATHQSRQQVQVAQGDYQILIQAGDELPGSGDIAGQIRARDDKTVILQSPDPDFNAFVPLNEEATHGYLFTNWEDRPGGMSRIRLQQNEQGQWQVTAGEMLDFSSVAGTWVNCFGTLSPWGTPLTSEELYFDDTPQWFQSDAQYFNNPQAMAQYLGYPVDGSGQWPNPYRYGYIVEIKDPLQQPKPVKLFAMGRFSHENTVVMPDNKTAYLSDDGHGTVFFKFVADRAGDLSAGTLYAARVTQAAEAVPADPYSYHFQIDWIKLAHGHNAQIEAWIQEYDHQQNVVDNDQAQYITQQQIEAWAQDRQDGRLDTVADDRAAFLESRKAAAAMGATAEFSKMEGVNINYQKAADGSVPYMYMAVGDIKAYMADDQGDIQMPKNRCGVLYRMKLDADYNVSTMEPVVVGGPYHENAAPNACAVDNIANPDNVVVLDDGRVLFGEDTSKHQNNMIWVWDEAVQ